VVPSGTGFWDFVDVARGFAAGIASGFWDAITGLPTLLWNLIWSPVRTVGGILAGINQIKEAVQNGNLAGAALMVIAPSLYELVTKPDLTWYDRGFLAGKTVGEFGARLGGVGLGTAAAFVGRRGFFGKLWDWVDSRGLLTVQRAAQQLAQVRRVLAGIPGVDKLVDALQSADAKIRKGAQFQAARGLEYARQGKLARIEVDNLRRGRGRPDLQLVGVNGRLIECKNWPGWLTSPLGERAAKVEELRQKIIRLLRGNGYQLKIEFANMVPNEVKQMLNGLPVNIGNRVQAVPIPFPS
jgi:hypothetical protein